MRLWGHQQCQNLKQRERLNPEWHGCHSEGNQKDGSSSYPLQRDLLILIVSLRPVHLHTHTHTHTHTQMSSGHFCQQQVSHIFIKHNNMKDTLSLNCRLFHSILWCDNLLRPSQAAKWPREVIPAINQPVYVSVDQRSEHANVSVSSVLRRPLKEVNDLYWIFKNVLFWALRQPVICNVTCNWS